MILNAFSLFDTKAQFFLTPWFMQAPGQAIRAAMDLGRDPTTVIGRHPSDYVLFRVGTFEDSTGQMMPCNPENLGNVASFLEPQRPFVHPSMQGNGSLPASPEA